MIKPVLRIQKNRKNDLHFIYIRISYRQKVRYIKLDYKIHIQNWDDDKGLVINHPNARFINLAIQKIMVEYESKLIKNDLSAYTINDIVKLLKSDSENLSFTGFYQTEFKPTIRAPRTAELYDNTIQKLEEFNRGRPISFRDIDLRFLNDFERYLSSVKQNSTNTISIEMRNIRAIYNRAISLRIIDREFYPFDHFKIQKRKTVKRNLDIEEIKKIANYQGDKEIRYGCQVFTLMFFMRGINAIDLYNLKEENIIKDYLHYQRKKTGKELSIKIEPEIKNLMQELKGENKLFSFQERYVNSDNFYKNINKKLKRLEGFSEITTYWSRHSWATIAARNRISKDVIAYGLSHGSDTVTDIYIEPSQELVDEAAKMVIDLTMM